MIIASQNAVHLPKLTLSERPLWCDLHTMAWSTALQNVVESPYPNWATHVACMPGVPISWVWDSCFIALYSRYSNGALPALGNLDNFYRHQGDDGFIAMAYHMERDEPAYGSRTNPPLFAWAELDVARQTGDLDRLGRVLPHLVSLFDWYKNNRRRADGLYWFEDSGSTGMDNSPRSGYTSQHLNGSDICHVDLLSQQAYAAESIVDIAILLDKGDIAARFTREREELLPLIDLHWCPRTSFYHDLFYHSDVDSRHNFVNHRTVASFWPLFAGACSSEQAAKLVSALTDPGDFGVMHPVPSLSRQDPNYRETGGYWLGGVWAPTNYMVVRGLRRYGYHALAREIVSQHLNAMHRVATCERYGGIWECYAPELDRPADTANPEVLCRPNFVGWSGLGPIAMLIEDILGLEFDALAKKVTWHIQESSTQGLENIAFAGGTVSLLADPDPGALKVTSDREFALEIRYQNLKANYAISPGSHELRLPKQ